MTKRCEIWNQSANIRPFVTHSSLQVCLDVHRCNSRIKPGTPSNKVLALKNRLKNVIIKSLAEKPGRHYYQVGII